jgi:hypothetical protein
VSSLLHVTARELYASGVLSAAVVAFFLFVVLPGDESLQCAIAQESDHA